MHPLPTEAANPVLFAIELFAVLPIAASIAVAVLRYRLFDIDKIGSRTVTYLLVLVVLVDVYAGVVAGLATLVPREYGQVGIAAATLPVSIVAAPLTRRARHVVERRFDRSRFDGERVAVAAAFAARCGPLRTEATSADLLEVVQRTVAPTHAWVWIGKSGHATATLTR